jgi:uracil-DNA glycosylase family 4
MTCRDIGPFDAKIMIIGEAPGREEESQGIPFVGQSGILLKQMVREAGIDYSRCYITNVCDVRPPANKFDYFYEGPKRVQPKDSLRKKWFELGDKIKSLKPSVIICLGNEPLRAVTNLKGVEKWRGTRIDAYDTKVIATYHPANILRAYYHRVIAVLDLKKAKRESEGLVYKAPEIIISPTCSDVLSWMNNLGPQVSFDIETIGKRIRAIAFATTMLDGAISAISIPFFRMSNSSLITKSNSTMISLGSPDINYWSQSDEELILEAIARIMEDSSIKKIGQNSIHFDSPLIESEFGIKTNNHYMDLMHAWHVLYPSIGVQIKVNDSQSGKKGLKFISTILTDHPNYWTKKDTQIDESEWMYNAMDAAVTLESAIMVEKELEDEGLSDLYFNHVHPLTFDLLKASDRGVLWDQEEANKMKLRLEKDKLRLTNELEQLTGKKDFNSNSPKQVKELLYGDLGFPKIYKRGTRTLTADEDAIKRLQAKYPNEPALAKIIQFRKTAKLISTYIDIALDDDGRVRCSYNSSGTITGRISSSKNLWGTGMDLHNIPKGYTKGTESTRHLFVAAPGNTFVVGDLKQAEAMVVAWILKSLGDSTLYDLYHDPSFDIHKWCAALVLEKPENQVTKNDRQQVGKLANHSGNYMSGPGVMEKRALKDGYDGFTYTLCKKYLARRKAAIPGLQWWWDDVERRLRASRTLTTCFGRRLHFFGRLDGEELRSAVAFEPQSTVGDVCNTMFRELSNKNDYWPVLTTHDEIVLETKDHRDYIDLATNAMILASRIPLHIRDGVEDLTIPIEIMTGPNWRDLEEMR